MVVVIFILVLFADCLISNNECTFLRISKHKFLKRKVKRLIYH